MYGLSRLSVPLLATSMSACAGLAPRLVSFHPEPTEPGCVRVSSGRDLNRDGRLAPSEVEETELLCDRDSGPIVQLALEVGPEPDGALDAPSSERSVMCTDATRGPAGGPSSLATRLSRRPRPAPRRRLGARRRAPRRWLTTVLRRFMALVSSTPTA